MSYTSYLVKPWVTSNVTKPPRISLAYNRTVYGWDRRAYFAVFVPEWERPKIALRALKMSRLRGEGGGT